MGFSVLYSLKAKENLDSPEIASIMAQGSYACLYLINSFSSLLQSAESFSEIYGLSERVLQLLRLLSHEKGDIQVSTEEPSPQGGKQIYKSIFESIFGKMLISMMISEVC